MNRRNFLKKAVMGVAAVAVAPSLLAIPAPINPGAPVVNAVIGEYCEYANFSSFAIREALDKYIQEVAAELGRRAGESISKQQRSFYV